MKLRIIIILIFMVLACTEQEHDQKKSTMRLFKKKDPIEAFWNWFLIHKDQFHKTDDSNKGLHLDMILAEISKIQPELSIEISRQQNGIRELTISPEGDRAKFEIVESIVAKAPAIDGWKIVAFRQPIGFDFTLEYQNIRLTPSELYFYPINKNGILDLIIYGNNFNQYDFNTLAHYGLIMMDNVLGEYDCVTKVRYYDFKDLSEVEDKKGLIPLKEIREYLKSKTQHQPSADR